MNYPNLKIKIDVLTFVINEMVDNMKLNEYCTNIDEKLLDNIVEGYSYTSIFRTMAFIGDSLSSGEFETYNSEDKPCYHDMYEYSWGQFIARKNGLTAYNFSCGGMTAKFYAEYYAAAKGFWSTDKTCKAYVIALGVNDIYNNKMEIGSIEDIDDKDYKKISRLSPAFMLKL